MKIIFEFSGGSRDGQTAEGDTNTYAARSEAATYYLFTQQGTIGKRFWTGTAYALDSLMNPLPVQGIDDVRAEKYEIMDRLESPETEEVYVRCRFVEYA